MKPGDLVVGVLEGAVETRVRPAVVISSTTYLVERPDCPGGDSHHAAAQAGGIHRLRPSGLAGDWASRGIPAPELERP